MVDAGGAFTTLEKTGTLLKLNKGAKTWAYSDVKPKTVHLHDGILTYSGGGSLGRTGGRGTTTVTVELCHVAQLRQSTVAGAPVGAFDLQMHSKPSRTYTFAPEPGATAQGWLGALAVAVPDSAVDHSLQALLRTKSAERIYAATSAGQPKAAALLAASTENSGQQQQQPVRKKLSFWRTSSKESKAAVAAAKAEEAAAAGYEAGFKAARNAQVEAAAAEAAATAAAALLNPPVRAQNAAMARVNAKKEEVRLRLTLNPALTPIPTLSPTLSPTLTLTPH